MKRAATILMIIMVFSMLFLPNSAAYAKTNLTDISNKHWAKGYINDLVDKKVFTGYEDNSFRPDNYIKVSEFTTVLVKHLGYQVSTSSDGGKWYTRYINSAITNGLIKNGEFSNYEAYISRAEMARMIVRGLNESPSKNQLTFVDKNDIKEAFKGYIKRASEIKIINGYGDKSFKPDNNATRSESCKMLSVMINYEQSIKNKRQDRPIEESLNQDIRKTEILVAEANAVAEDFSFDVSKDVSGSDYTVLDDVTSEERISMNVFDKLYIGGSKGNDGESYDVGLYYNGEEVDSVYVNGSPSEGQNYRESDNFDTPTALVWRTSSSAQFSIAEDKSGKDTKYYENLTNGSRTGFDVLRNNMYIGGVKDHNGYGFTLSINVRYQSGAEIPVGSVYVYPGSMPGEGWRASENISYNKEKNFVIKVSNAPKSDNKKELELQEVNYIGPALFKITDTDGNPNNDITAKIVADISGKDYELGTIKNDTVVNGTHLYDGRGVYAGGSEGNVYLPYKIYAFGIDEHGTPITLGKIDVAGSPLQGQNYRESKNMEPKKIIPDEITYKIVISSDNVDEDDITFSAKFSNDNRSISNAKNHYKYDAEYDNDLSVSIYNVKANGNKLNKYYVRVYAELPEIYEFVK